MKLAPLDTCLEDYDKRRKAFLKELIASTPNVSVRAKEFRPWIDENLLALSRGGIGTCSK